MSLTAWNGRHPVWLEIIEGSAPVLLIAPHGGAAMGDHPFEAIPKVNDLHTPAITRELARQLHATALINSAMDRNHLDCNRVGQLIEAAPWFLTTLAERLRRIVENHGYAIVAAIHGWNLVEPRVDIGIGMRETREGLTPVRGATVSVSSLFFQERLIPLTARLRECGIAATFGMRYPAASAENLIQALTIRYLNSQATVVAGLALLCERYRVEATQLELSLAVRFPGGLRDHFIEAFSAALSARLAPELSARSARRIPHSASLPRSAQSVRTNLPAERLGFEAYDTNRGLTILASFDATGRTRGARIMILLPNGETAMYSCEGRIERGPDGIAIGAIEMVRSAGSTRISFQSPILLTPPETGYFNVERALAVSRLEESARFEAELTLDADFDVAGAIQCLGQGEIDLFPSLFGRMRGRLSLGDLEFALDATGRIGPSLTSLGDRNFRSRQAIWASFDRAARFRWVELKERLTADNRRVFNGVAGAAQNRASAGRLTILPIAPLRPPRAIEASFYDENGEEVAVDGFIKGYLPLVRPGPSGGRIFTLLGSAIFFLEGREGAGMFEYSGPVIERPKIEIPTAREL
jgi:hypothetical protein